MQDLSIVRELRRPVNTRAAPEEGRAPEYQYSSAELRGMRQKWRFQSRLRSVLPMENATAHCCARAPSVGGGFRHAEELIFPGT